MDSNSAQATLDQAPLWVGAADYVAQDPYPCYQNARCDFAWIDAVIAAADHAGLPYWGVVQAFEDEEWRWPTPSEERHMFCQCARSREWGYVVFSWTRAGHTLTEEPRFLKVLRHFDRGSLRCPRRGD